MKLRVTLTWSYEANPKYYGTTDPVKMAEIDQSQGDLEAVLSMGMEQFDFEYKVTPEPE